MADDLGLLLDSVLLEFPAGLENVVVAAPWMAVQQQVPVALGLGLPDVRQFMNEEALPHRPHG
ncbi:hypothetical protein D3C83_176570 [compost metagenome]